MDDHGSSYIIKMKIKEKVPRRGLSSPCLDNQKKKNTFVLLLQKPKMKNKRNKKKGTSHFSPKQRRRRIVIDNNPPLPSLHWDFDEQTPSLLSTIIKKSQFFGTYSKHSKWVFNFKFNIHEGNIVIG